MKETLKIIQHDARPIHCYIVNEHDLRNLAFGSTEGQNYFDLACVLIPIGLTGLVGTLNITSATSIWLSLVYVVTLILFPVLGIIFYVLYRNVQKTKRPLLDSILDSPISMGDDEQETEAAADGAKKTTSGVGRAA